MSYEELEAHLGLTPCNKEDSLSNGWCSEFAQDQFWFTYTGQHLATWENSARLLPQCLRFLQALLARSFSNRARSPEKVSVPELVAMISMVDRHHISVTQL